jgi:arsenite methyltransferase
MAPRFIAKQLSRPTGLLGAAIRHLMNWHNARMNAYAIQQLRLEASDRVLEIGFGGGATLPALLEMAAFVAGVDRSRDVVTWAQRRFATAVEAGHAEFHQENVESLSFKEEAFDKVCTVNTVYFWSSLEAGFAEICAFSNLEGVWSSDFFRRNVWIAWACPPISSRRARPLRSSAHSQGLSSGMC